MLPLEFLRIRGCSIATEFSLTPVAASSKLSDFCGNSTLEEGPPPGATTKDPQGKDPSEVGCPWGDPLISVGKVIAYDVGPPCEKALRCQRR